MGEWRDLSDDELSARLAPHRQDWRVRELVANRDEDPTGRLIDSILGDGA